MLITKDTDAQATQPSWIVLEDIARRAAHAYNTHQELFDSAEHQERVAQAKEICRAYFAGWSAIYETARQQTSRRAAHTELKFNRVVLRKTRNRDRWLESLRAIGIDEVVYKPATESYSLHIR